MLTKRCEIKSYNIFSRIILHVQLMHIYVTLDVDEKETTSASQRIEHIHVGFLPNMYILLWWNMYIYEWAVYVLTFCGSWRVRIRAAHIVVQFMDMWMFLRRIREVELIQSPLTNISRIQKKMANSIDSCPPTVWNPQSRARHCFVPKLETLPTPMYTYQAPE